MGCLDRNGIFVSMHLHVHRFKTNPGLPHYAFTVQQEKLTRVRPDKGGLFQTGLVAFTLQNFKPG